VEEAYESDLLAGDQYEAAVGSKAERVDVFLGLDRAKRLALR